MIDIFVDFFLFGFNQVKIKIHEKSKRNKACLTLQKDLDTINYKIMLMKIKHIRPKDRYGEGENTYESKQWTGSIDNLYNIVLLITKKFKSLNKIFPYVIT